jgi:hypothetical protein
LVVVGIALTVLLGVVAFVSRGHVSPTGSGAHDRGASQMLANIVFTIWILAMLAGTVLLLYMYGLRKRAKSREQWRLRPVVVTLFFGAAVVLAFFIAANQLGSNDKGKRGGPNANTPTKLSKADRKHRLELKRNVHSPSFNWELAAGIIALIAAVSLTAIIRSYRRRSDLLRELTVHQELSELLDETLDDLRRETDPRRAVIAAYARMERILSVHGLPRRPSEAPVEYLGRVLLELRVSEKAVTNLTGLFARAKFSQHEIDPEMKEEAIDALVAIREDLRAADAPDAPTLSLKDVPGGAA